jgi:5'-methylthioadenosine phosphorylase
VLRRIKARTRYGKPSDSISIVDIGSGPFAFLPRHGRLHRLAPDAIPYRANLEALHQLGVRRIVATCVVGSLNTTMAPGHFAVPDQFVEFTNGRLATTGGAPVHLPLGEPYCPAIRNLLFDTATDHTETVHRHATVVVTQGPRFATRAENQWYAAQGWDIINMTQFPEAYLARHYGICYAALASITDFAYGIGAADRHIGSTASMAPVLKVFHANRRISETVASLAAYRVQTENQEPCFCARPMPPEYYRQEDPDDRPQQPPRRSVWLSAYAIRSVASPYIYWPR